jgi:hypothetical protein
MLDMGEYFLIEILSVDIVFSLPKIGRIPSFRVLVGQA